MKQRTLLGLALVAGGGLVLAFSSGGSDTPTGKRTSSRYGNNGDEVRRAFEETRQAGAALRKNRTGGLPSEVDVEDDGTTFAVSGTIRERGSASGVGDVEVVFANDEGEASAVTSADGSYATRLPRGGYRVFVRSDKTLMLGERPRDPFAMDFRHRIPGEPREDAMPAFRIAADRAGVDLEVSLAGWIDGRVVDGAGRPLAGVMINGGADSNIASLLGTDLDVSDADGRFHLQVPAGTSQLAINDDRFAGLADSPWIAVGPGEHVEATLVAVAGCRIRGHVFMADGTPARDGALEQTRNLEYGGWGTTGHILDDGSFDFAVTDAEDIHLRAWPWKSPPSAPQTFACADGKVYDGIEFRLPPQTAALSGTIVDADGNPVALTYLDIDLVEGPGGPGSNQIERTDEAGEFKVFAMPPGRYVVTSHAPGRGVVAVEVTVPSQGVRVQLGGTGSVTGSLAEVRATAARFAASGCMIEGHRISISEPAQVVALDGARFRVDGVPTCDRLEFSLETLDNAIGLVAAVKRDQAVEATSDMPDDEELLELSGMNRREDPDEDAAEPIDNEGGSEGDLTEDGSIIVN